MTLNKKTIYRKRAGALRSKGTELTTKERRACLPHLFFWSDLCHLIKAKTIHVVWPALQSQELMLLEAFQRKDVSAYTGLNTAVNNSSAMMEHKYKTGSHLWTRTQMHVLSRWHTPHPQYNYTRTRYTWPLIRTPLKHTHAATVCTQRIHKRTGTGARWVKTQNSANVWQHITQEPKQPTATWAEKTSRSSQEFTEKIQTLPNVCLQSLPGVDSPLGYNLNRIHSKCLDGCLLARLIY